MAKRKVKWQTGRNICKLGEIHVLQIKDQHTIEKWARDVSRQHTQSKG